MVSIFGLNYIEQLHSGYNRKVVSRSQVTSSLIWLSLLEVWLNV